MGAYTKEPGVIARVGGQYKRVLETKGLPEDLRERYNRFSGDIGKSEAVECSLVHRASGSYPGLSFGHIIHVPDFGKIVLGKLKVTHEKHDTPTKAPRITHVHLTMVDLELGCAAPMATCRLGAEEPTVGASRNNNLLARGLVHRLKSRQSVLVMLSGQSAGIATAGRISLGLFLLLLLLFLPIEDSRPQTAQEAYDQASSLLQRGDSD